MTKSRSCPNLARIASQGDIYMNTHFEDDCEVARGDVQAGEKVNGYGAHTYTHKHTHTHIVCYLRMS